MSWYRVLYEVSWYEDLVSNELVPSLYEVLGVSYKMIYYQILKCVAVKLL